MTEQREAVPTVGYIDEYCQDYRSLFADVRSFEAFKFVHVGMLSAIPRKSLPAIAKLVGLGNSQNLQHLFQNTEWNLESFRDTRLLRIRQAIGEQEIVLCIDETGDAKKGQATDYVAKQYIGNIGQTASGIVSVNAYAVVGKLTYPLLFKVFKPQSRLKAGDVYKTKTQLAIEILQEVHRLGFKVKVVLADSLYGECSAVIAAIIQLHWSYIVAIRSNHGVWMHSSQKVRYNRWHAYDQPLEQYPPERRYIREIIFGTRRSIRYFQISKGATDNPDKAQSWQIMTNLCAAKVVDLPGLYVLRTWIEYGFKQVKNELGWTDFRLTDYASIERWWEMVFSAYLLVSLHAKQFENGAETILPFHEHPLWEAGITWKSALNNLRLLLQPYLCWEALEFWLQVFPIAGIKRGLFKLMDFMDSFHILPEATFSVAS
jgi:SRSO17 transposase